MVVVKIGDGMGNQLYNYACGYASARRDGDTLMLDISECDNSTLRNFELDNFHIKYDAKESFPNGTLWQKIYKRLRRDIKYHVLKERSVYAPGKKNHTPANVDMRVFKKKRLRNKYLHGYWQNTVYFEEYLGEICGMLTPAYEQSEETKRLIAEFQTTDTCAVHVRGGDIVGPGRAFFERAFARMRQERPGVRFIVFTNDMESAKAALPKEGISYIADMGAFSDVDEFFLMAACRNQIISNSTYSTWAAYLNPNEEKVVIMPEHELGEYLRLPGWIVL